jgi:hypothetical protein
MISRRTFALGIGSAAVVWPRTARAQQKAMPVIGYLHFGSPGPFAYQLVAFRQGLAILWRECYRWCGLQRRICEFLHQA